MVNSQNNEFGKLIRKYRIANGISLRKFAKYLGLSPTYISQMERGFDRPLHQKHFPQISELLGIPELQLVECSGRQHNVIADAVLARPGLLEAVQIIQTLPREKLVQFIDNAVAPEHRRYPCPNCHDGNNYRDADELEIFVGTDKGTGIVVSQCSTCGGTGWAEYDCSQEEPE